ncbi:MAG: Integral membrane protein [uncultured Thermomicrobiales bacterium]|uniref:Integral membrane protein n=1 Tax=uncultured Thermomicrobiales bacterium TaxID=1645740 RepID=A0A6J4UIT5_9BACT|nr:MAG: Integral membrane protein [uncultured Thermomicrobiales bacterium]
MASDFSTAGLARSSARRPWWTVGAWVALLVVAVGLMAGLGMKTTSEVDFTNDPEAKHGLELIEAAGLSSGEPTNETVIVRHEGSTVDDPAFKARVEQVTAALRGMDGVVDPASVTNFYELSADAATAGGAAGLVSPNRQTTLIPVTLSGTLDDAATNAHQYLADLETQAGDGFEVLSVGFVSIGEENNVIAEEDLLQGEAFGIGAALVILIIVFGALVAAGVPLILAIVSIMISFGITAVLGQVLDLSFFITNMITMIGLAVGIDYALFVVERYREERRRGRTKAEAIGVAGGTASKAVAFSGGTVVLALAGMLLIPATIFQALAIGAIIVVVVAVFAALTLIPAVLSLLGDKIDWPRRRDYDAYALAHANEDPHNLDAVHRGFWGRITKTVMARPIVSVVAAVALLVLAAVPYFDINRGFAGVEAMPADSSARHGFEILNEEFSAGRLAPVQFAIEGSRDAAQTGIENLRAALAAETVEDGDGTKPAFLPIPDGEWASWNADGTVALLEATLTVPSNEARAYAEIEHLRDEIVPAAFAGSSAQVFVTGETAFNQDFFDMVQRYTPIVLAFVLGLSFVLLLLAFRSVVVSAKAIVMNLLSVGAAYGLLVLVFQKGVGADLFGFQQTPTIEAWLPIFLFCVLFGLSMDYHVFLLSRIREHYDATGRNTESVAVGLHSTAKIITGAALIMVAVFGGFAAGRLVMLQQMGFGLGVAVLLDATIVRSILVPSAMALLGDRNWYLPKWLTWLPDLRVEGAPLPAPKLAPVSSPTPMPEGAAD